MGPVGSVVGSRWSIDGPVRCDPGHDQAVIEFTAERKNPEMIIRGSEWYRFDPGTGLITEIRGYLASPPAPGFQRLELGGFPYAERGYAAST